MFADYLVLDALIGNTDRHHENWGLLMKQVGDHLQGILAPTFDHVSALGRELLDTKEGKGRERLLQEGRVGDYAEKAHGAIFWETTDRRGLGPLESVRTGSGVAPGHIQASTEPPQATGPARCRNHYWSGRRPIG